ncbi:MAG: AAA family ATPase [Myxococcaceae bacterium]
MIRSALQEISRNLVEREALLQVIALAAVAREHVLVIGPPGTAKSEAVRRIASALGGSYFEYLLGRFTEPGEVFGPVDLRKLKEGLVETDSRGMLPEADVVFLDEVFHASTAILNTLLGILNERVFRRGHTRVRCPLRICVAASNALPEDESLAAFADRFLCRVFVEPIPDAQLETLLEVGWASSVPNAAPSISIAQLDALSDTAARMELAPIRPHLAHAIRQLRSAGISLTDRRTVKVQRLIAAAAVLAGRDHPTEADLWPLLYAIPTPDAQRTARDVLRELLARSENATLPAAAEEASLGPLARVARIVNAGRSVFDARPDGSDLLAVEGWRLKLEGLAREIDAGFSPEALTPELGQLRAEIIEAVRR